MRSNLSSCDRILTIEQLLPIVEQHRQACHRIVFTNGCFDMLHVGHLTVLEEAAELGDILIVAVNSDASVKVLKGPDRPVVGEKDRARLLAALSCVDYVTIFAERTPKPLLKSVRPDVLVKGGTYKRDEIIGYDIVESYGGEIHITSEAGGVSTTALLDAIHKRRGWTLLCKSSASSSENQMNDDHVHL